MIVFTLEEFHEIVVRLSCRTLIFHIAHTYKKCPVSFRGRIMIVKSVKGSGKSIFFMEIPQIFLKYRIILIEKIIATGSGHAGCCSYQNGFSRIKFI